MQLWNKLKIIDKLCVSFYKLTKQQRVSENKVYFKFWSMKNLISMVFKNNNQCYSFENLINFCHERIIIIGIGIVTVMIIIKKIFVN